jgi:hypothetical protein
MAMYRLPAVRAKRLVASYPLPSAQVCPQKVNTKEIIKEMTKEMPPPDLLLLRRIHEGECGKEERSLPVFSTQPLSLLPPFPFFFFSPLLEFPLGRLALCVILGCGQDRLPTSVVAGKSKTARLHLVSARGPGD